MAFFSKVTNMIFVLQCTKNVIQSWTLLNEKRLVTKFKSKNMTAMDAGEKKFSFKIYSYFKKRVYPNPTPFYQIATNLTFDIANVINSKINNANRFFKLVFITGSHVTNHSMDRIFKKLLHGKGIN